MCDPTLLIGAALTAGSIGANSMAQSNVASARSQAMDQERARQAAYQAQARAATDKDLTGYQNFQGSQDASAKTLGDYYASQKQASTPTGTVAQAEIPASSSNIVNQETAKQQAKVGAYADQQGQALGQLRSFGDVLGGLNRGTARVAGQVGQIGNFEQGSSGVSKYELDAANHAGDGLKFFGDLLGAGGNLGVSAGLKGGFTTGGITAPSIVSPGISATRYITSL